MEFEGPYAADLSLALDIAEAVDALTLAGMQGELRVETKADDTPVTAIDRSAEQLIRERLAQARPGDAVLGEEFGSAGTGERRWVIDPIDGTKNFVRGVPVWATLIGLLDGDRCAVGVVSAPALGRRWFAAAGSGAWGVTRVHGFPTEPRRLAASSINRLAEASLSMSSIGSWAARGADPILELQRSVKRTRGFGDFWSYMMVAEGSVDIATEPELELYDMAALVPIVEEAGGCFTGLDGKPGPFSGDALATNGSLHDEVLLRLRAR